MTATGCLPVPPADRAPSPVLRAVGGPTGLLLSALPPALLVAVDSVAGWATAVTVAAAVAVLTCVLRIRRGHAAGPAAGGLVGVGISAAFAFGSGSAAGWFAVDVGWSVLACSVFAGSLLLRRPLVGVVWRATGGPPIRHRRAVAATAAWAAVFAARAVVQGRLWADEQIGWLAVAKIGMGLPLTVLAVAVTAWAVRPADR